MENGGLENSIEEDIEKKISWKKRINLRNEKNQNKDDKIKEVSSTVQSIRYHHLKSTIVFLSNQTSCALQ